ncbi:MAG: phosphatase PAP2 family protein [Candidatus Micrarchaeia archaeon]
MDLTNLINTWAFDFAKIIASPWLNIIMKYIGESFLIVIPLVAIYLYFKKDKNVFSFSVLFFLLYFTSEIIKLIVREKRPCNIPSLSWINNIGCESSFSFPSNHATVLSGLVLFTSSYKYLEILYTVWLIFVLFGRVYLGLHYFTDVVVGVLISFAIVWFIRKYYSKKINSKLSRIFCIIFRKLKICPKGW